MKKLSTASNKLALSLLYEHIDDMAKSLTKREDLRFVMKCMIHYGWQPGTMAYTHWQARRA